MCQQRVRKGRKANLVNLSEVPDIEVGALSLLDGIGQLDLGKRRVLCVNGDTATITLFPICHLRAQVEEHAKDLNARPDAQVCLTQHDEARQLRDAVGPQMVRLQFVESQKLLEEWTC